MSPSDPQNDLDLDALLGDVLAEEEFPSELLLRYAARLN